MQTHSCSTFDGRPQPYRYLFGGWRQITIEATFWVVVAGSGTLIWWLGEHRLSSLPAWMPWDFSWLQFLATALALWWFAKGLRNSAPNDRPPVWRRVSYVGGVLLCYAAVQTHYDYLAQHMFFFSRIQHLGLHHAGPFLIALGWPGGTIKRGLPSALRRLVESSPVVTAVNLLQLPWLSATLFVGLLYFWLLPAIHLPAMLNPALYAMMNWSMVIDGIAFWYLILDPRPVRSARLSIAHRTSLAIAVIPAQVLLGVVVAIGGPQLYPSFDLCGRLLDGVTAALDLQIGGLIIAIPATMMSLIALFFIASRSATPHGNAQSQDSTMSENANGGGFIELTNPVPASGHFPSPAQ